MEQTHFQDKFKQLRGKIKETWGRLADNEIDMIEGQQDQFFSRLEETYGIAKEDGLKRLLELEKACGYGADKSA